MFRSSGYSHKWLEGKQVPLGLHLVQQGKVTDSEVELLDEELKTKLIELGVPVVPWQEDAWATKR